MSSTAQSAISEVPSDSPDPVVDVAGHLRELRSVALLAITFGVVIGVIVLVIRGFWPVTYEVVTTARVGGPMISSPNQIVVQASGAPFIALASDQRVVEEVAAETGLSGGDEVADRVSVALSEAPGFVQISVTGDDLDECRRIGESMVSVMDRVSVDRTTEVATSSDEDLSARLAELDEQIRQASDSGTGRSKLSSLYTERDELTRRIGEKTTVDQPSRLAVLAVETNNGQPVAPKPLGEAAVAGIVAAILLAEAVVLANGRLGSTVAPAWARRIARAHGVDVDSGPAEECGLPLATDIVRTQLLREKTTLLYIGIGDEPKVTPAGADTVVGDEIMVEADSPWWRDVDADEISLALVVVDEGKVGKDDTVEVLDRLALVDIPARLVVRESTDFSGPFGWLKI